MSFPLARCDNLTFGLFESNPGIHMECQPLEHYDTLESISGMSCDLLGLD